MTQTFSIDARNLGRGTIHIHKAGCADLRQPKFRSPETSWAAEVADLRAIVVDIYDPDCFDYDVDAEWQNFAGDLHVYPCLKDLPDEAPTAA